MNQVDDVYADLQAYIQLVENEIDEVISGRLTYQKSLKTVTGTSFNKLNNEQVSVSIQKKTDKTGEEKATKPPKGSGRENRTGTKKAEGFDRRKIAMCLRKGTLPEDSNAVRLSDLRTECLLPRAVDKIRYSPDAELRITALEDLYVAEETEGKDLLLERILDKEGKSEAFAPTPVTSVNYARLGSARKNEHPKDLHKLLLSDRNSLLLGCSDNVDSSNPVANDSEYGRKTTSRNLQSVHHCQHPRYHHRCHHRHHSYTDPGVCPPLQTDHLVLRRHSSQPCHRLQHHHHRFCDCSSSENEPLDKHRQKKRAELLARIHNDVNLENKPVSPDQLRYTKSLLSEPASTSTLWNPDLFLRTNDINSESSFAQSSMEIDEEDASSSDRSGTDSELREHFDQPQHKFTSGHRGKLSRKSYPNNDNLIISPPPGFDSPVNDDTWIKIRMVTRSHDDLRYKMDQRVWPIDGGDEIANSAAQYCSVPYELEISPESRCYVTQSANDLHLPVNSPANNWKKNDLAFYSPTNNVQKNILSHNSVKKNGQNNNNIPFNYSVQNGQRSDLLYNSLIEIGKKDDLPFNSTLKNGQKNDLPYNSSLQNGNQCEDVRENISQNADCEGDIMQLSCSSHDESVDLTSPSESSGSEGPEDRDLNFAEGYFAPGQEKGLATSQLSMTLFASNGNVCPLILSGNESDIKNTTNNLAPSTVGWLTSSFKVQDQESPPLSFQASEEVPENREDINELVNSRGILKFPDVLGVFQSELKQTAPGATDLKVTNTKIDTDLDLGLLLNLEEDNNNNNTSSNLFSMCLASNCKHLKSHRSQEVPESFTKPHLIRQNVDILKEVSATHLAYESSKCTREPDSNNIKPKCVPDLSSGNETYSTSNLHRNNKSSIGKSVKAPICPETSCMNTSAEEVHALSGNSLKCEQDFGRILNFIEASGKSLIKKSVLRDTAIQTSLELDGFVIDISENVPDQDMMVKAVNGGGEPMERATTWTDGSSENSNNCDGMIERERETFDKKRKLIEVNSNVETKDGLENKSMVQLGNRNDQQVLQENEGEVRRPPKVLFLRCKSIHGSGTDGSESKSAKCLRPETPSLCGSLRELSHLNIDVSQRLVDGEQRFVVANGSPELQVMVNALTPVLSRRNRTRNVRRLQQVSPKEEMSGIITTSASGYEFTPHVVGDSSHAFHKPHSSQIVFDSSSGHSGNESLPEYARFSSQERFCSRIESVGTNTPMENESTYKNGLKERKSISDKHNQISKSTVTNSGSPSAAQQRSKANLSGSNKGNEFQLDLAVNNNDLPEELEESSSKNLFLSPKLAHTWHGASASIAHRSTPRMGVSRIFNDGVKYICGPDRKIRPVAMLPSVLTSPSQYPQNSYTMPVISRTLLDALHKRYCSHQYSSNYQTLQPFSLLKLDSNISTRNQFVTALLVEPRLARDHEVQAAPPSPEVMTRLRMLSNINEANRDKDDGQSLRQQTDQEQPPRLLRLPQISSEWPHQQPTPTCYQNQQECLKSSKVEQHQDVWHEVTPNSSPNLTDKLNHSGKHHAELEAAEALKWLRAAGFPQYAQMFDDGHFPVDMGVVEKDHDFLDKDSLQSLFRRLETLNKYAGTKLGAHPCKKATSEEDEEDDFCALSERWEYQKSARRWSRKDLTPSSQKAAVIETDKRELATHTGSHDSLLADQDSESQVGDSPLLESKMPHQSIEQPQGKIEMWSLSQGGHAAAEITPESHDDIDYHIRPRAGSERMKTAKSLLKKMEGFKSSTKSRRHRNIAEISGPVVADKANMQAKLEKLNCVDILQTTETLPSSQSVSLTASGNSRYGSPSGADGLYILHDGSNNQTSPQSPAVVSSPRPRSDFMLRPRETSYPTSTHFTSSNHTFPTQHSSSSHDSNFEGYYQAHTTFLQNLQSTQAGTSEVVRKNNSDTNLMEIFLVPQDHQPGRFPRMLQNGYIETEACGTAVNARTGSVRLGRGTGLTSDRRNAGSSKVAQPPGVPASGYRVSVYDNFLPPDGKRQEDGGAPSTISKVTEPAVSVCGSEAVRSSSVEGAKISINGLTGGVNSESIQHDSKDTSRDSSVVRMTESVSDQEYRSSVRDRSVSFESPASSRTPQGSIVASEGGTASTDSRDSRKSSPDSLSSKSRGVSHSSSVDSYFQGSSRDSDVPSNDNSENTPASSFQQDYDEFDRILQELYRNINDLTSFMDRDKNEKAPKLVRAATTPLPAGIKKHSPLHVVTPSAQPVLKSQRPAVDPHSPSSATSDLVHSPASPRSPQDSEELMNFYRVLDLDQENSSSGGEGSNTAESGSEDQETVLTDASHDESLDQIIEVSRERRDSGVGHSLTRAPSDRRRKKIRWHSFQKCHRPDISSRAMQINSLTVGQLVRLQKLSLLKLTGIMEKCLPVNKSGWNWMVPRFMKRHKAPDFSDKSVFGVPLSVMAQRTGQPLPQCVLYAMRYLRRTCQSAVGIFRKSGVKSKIQQLRDYLEVHPDTTNFDGENAYNVADMLKTYFRDLPECLLTNKMSETFRSIYTYVPQQQRLEAIQAAILLLPDENREVLQSILLFLSDIAAHEADHQMNASNLAVCFTPTVFHLGPRQSVPYSPKRNRKNTTGVPDPREIMEQKAAHECLLMMITECKKLFTVPSNLFRQLQVQSLAHMEQTLPQNIGNSPADVRAFGQERIQMVLKEAHEKTRDWIPTMTVGDVEVFQSKPTDDCPLKEWKLIVDIEAPPIEVLRRIMHERHTWDEDLLSWSVVERLDPYSDVFQFVLNSMAPHPPRNYCVLRYWRSDLNKGACALITMSVEHSDALEIHGVWAIDLGTYFLMEPCGSGRCRLMYITRVDTRGRMPEWYTKIFGHICANFLERLKESFKQDTSGPETKV